MYSTVTLDSGIVNGGSAGDACTGIRSDYNSTVNMNGGTINAGTGVNWSYGIYASSGTVNITAGTINAASGDFSVYGATVNVHGGTLNGSIIATSVNVYGGTITPSTNSWYSIRTEGGGSIQGGNLTGTVVVDSGTMNISGGTITSGLCADDAGVINIYGSNFDYGCGPIIPTHGTLTGTLADGSTLNLTFSQQSAGEIILNPAPEPATLSLLAFGGIAMLRRRKSNARSRVFTVLTDLPLTI
jgi:hypothetical protein